MPPRGRGLNAASRARGTAANAASPDHGDTAATKTRHGRRAAQARPPPPTILDSPSQAIDTPPTRSQALDLPVIASPEVVPAQSPSSGGVETFDLNVSSSDESEDQPVVAQQEPCRQRTRRKDMNEPEMPDVLNDPINQTSRSRSATNVPAEDVRHFFYRDEAKKEPTHCKPCK